MTWYSDSTLLYETDVTLQKKSGKFKRGIESDDILVSNIIPADDSPVYYNLMMIKEFSDLQMENEQRRKWINHRSSGLDETDTLEDEEITQEDAWVVIDKYFLERGSFNFEQIIDYSSKRLCSWQHLETW